MPNPSRTRVILSLSSTESDNPSLWVPSRNVVSNKWICMGLRPGETGGPAYCRIPAGASLGRRRSGVEQTTHGVANGAVVVRQHQRVVGVFGGGHPGQL